MNNQEQKNRIYNYYKAYYQDQKSPKGIQEFFEHLMQEKPSSEIYYAIWDLIENFMYDSGLVAYKAQKTLAFCINCVIEELEVSEKEVVDAISRALIEERIKLSYSDHGMERELKKNDRPEVFKIILALQGADSKSEYQKIVQDTQITYNDDKRFSFANAHYTRNMICVLKEENDVNSKTREKLQEIEGQMNNFYSKFIELSGILIAIFSVIGFNLLNIQDDNLGIQLIIVVNCMIVFAVAVLCGLIEVILFKKRGDKKTYGVIGVIAILALGVALFVVYKLK